LDEELKDLPVITTAGTSGLASILQITDDTPNEVFTFRHSTSGTETVIVVNVPIAEENNRVNESK
jgi:hypothetical protein